MPNDTVATVVTAELHAWESGGSDSAEALAAWVGARLAGHEAALAALLAVEGPRTVDNTLRLYDTAIEQLSLAGAQAGILNSVAADKSVRDQLTSFEAMGYGKFPICMAKTQYSFTTNPDAKGAPSDHVIPVREVRLSAGAEFVVVICGELLTMPGLPKVPAADSIDIGPDGRIVGLF